MPNKLKPVSTCMTAPVLNAPMSDFLCHLLSDFQESLVPIGKDQIRFLGTPIYSQISGFPGANRAKTSLRSLFKASRELLQFMHWSATVSDTVTDFQDLRCRTLKTSFDLSRLRRVTSTCIRLPLMPLQTSRNPWFQTSLDQCRPL